MWKKPIAVLLTGVMLFSLVLSGCSNKETGKDSATGTVTPGKTQSTATATKPAATSDLVSENENAQEKDAELSEFLPSKEEILASMELANRYFLNKYPLPGADADKTHPGNIWTKGTYLQGLMALYRINNDSSLYQYAVDWGTYFNWNARSGNRTTNADDQNCMQTYIELYQIEPEWSRIENVIICMDNMIDRGEHNYWTWIDAIFMAMPVLVKLSVVENDTKYSEEAYKCYSYTKNTLGLYDTSKSLWWRDSTFKGGDIYWSRGNGWVFAAFARVLSVLPKTDAHYDEYVTTFKEMAAALKACQRSDGFWNPDLLNPNNYGGKETSGTALFTYGMAWGINEGILDMDEYLPCVTKAWNGMIKYALHDDGFLGWVQGTGKQPSDAQPLSYTRVPNFEDYGLGAFLLAGSEVYRLAGE